MKKTEQVLERTILKFGRGLTAEQRQRNQKNLAAIRKMIDAAKVKNELNKI